MDRLCTVVGHLAPCAKDSAANTRGTAAAASGVHGYAGDSTQSKRFSWDGILSKKSASGSLKGQTMFISGASRGIGLAIAVRAARDGANVIIAAKTAKPHPRLPGTIFTAAEAIRKAGGRAIAVQTDIRSEEQVQAAIDAGVKEFGGIDICVNNASAISLTPTDMTSMKRYDLMHQVNIRGTFLASKLCLPYLLKSKNPHILNISPPLNMEERWFAPHVAYTMAKFGMSMCVLGMAGEFRDSGIAVNALWPRSTIATSAVKNLLGGDQMISMSRTPEIMADAAHVVLTRDSKQVTGQFFIDEDLLRSCGVTEFGRYAVTPGTPDSQIAPDFFV